MKIYTKKGDAGSTSLIGGERVSKCDAQVEAYGTVDELSAHTALLADMMRQSGRFAVQVAQLERILSELMYVEAILATGRGVESGMMKLPGEAVERLEAEIDRMNEDMEPVREFTIPGGDPIVSQSHVCRTVCRRAERAAVAIPDDRRIAPEAIAYLNRLSDWLYLAGRTAVKILGVKEVLWKP